MKSTNYKTCELLLKKILPHPYNSWKSEKWQEKSWYRCFFCKTLFYNFPLSYPIKREIIEGKIVYTVYLTICSFTCQKQFGIDYNIPFAHSDIGLVTRMRLECYNDNRPIPPIPNLIYQLEEFSTSKNSITRKEFNSNLIYPRNPPHKEIIFQMIPFYIHEQDITFVAVKEDNNIPTIMTSQSTFSNNNHISNLDQFYQLDRTCDLLDMSIFYPAMAPSTKK